MACSNYNQARKLQADQPHSSPGNAEIRNQKYTGGQSAESGSDKIGGKSSCHGRIVTASQIERHRKLKTADQGNREAENKIIRHRQLICPRDQNQNKDNHKEDKQAIAKSATSGRQGGEAAKAASKEKEVTG